jgi:hypothetical protein
MIQEEVSTLQGSGVAIVVAIMPQPLLPLPNTAAAAAAAACVSGHRSNISGQPATHRRRRLSG